MCRPMLQNLVGVQKPVQVTFTYNGADPSFD